MNTTTTIVLIVLLVLVAIAVAAVLAASRRKRRREALKERFGPEYDRSVEADGGRRAAERRLKGVADQRDKLEIRALESAERERYSSEWSDVQAAFVDAPDQAVFRADRLVGEVMRDRGYPVDDFDSKIDMVAVDHPQIASDYRSAHEIAVRRKAGEAGTTEDLRQAFVHYRSLFGDLLSDGGNDLAEEADAHGSAERERDDDPDTDRAPNGRPSGPDGGRADEDEQSPRDQPDTNRAGATAARNDDGYVEGAPIDATETERASDQR